MVFKEIEGYGSDQEGEKADHEVIPQEELWEDGELNASQVQHKILHHTLQQGDWLLVRRIENGKD